MEDFAVRGKELKDEVQIYTWKDATLRELTDLALLSGCSAGGLTTIIHCDEFRGFFPQTTKVKCLSDAGLFLDAIDVSRGHTIKNFFSGVVRLQGVQKRNLKHEKLVFLLCEHRYYGKSFPFGGNEEVANANSSTLRYLSSTQALADYATLIIDLKKNLSATDTPVIVIGGSYGGMLAAWFRLKYPHVAIGALASSAPILQFLDLVSPYTSTNIIPQDFKEL